MISAIGVIITFTLLLNVLRIKMQWAQRATEYTDAAKKELAEVENADAWVVAYAIAPGWIVVTHERFDPSIKRRIPIPNIWRAFNLPYIDTFDRMRRLVMKL